MSQPSVAASACDRPADPRPGRHVDRGRIFDLPMNIGDLELFLIELPASDGAGALAAGAAGRPNRLRRLGRNSQGLAAAASWRAAAGAVGGAGRSRGRSTSRRMLALDALADRAVACGVEMALWDADCSHARPAAVPSAGRLLSRPRAAGGAACPPGTARGGSRSGPALSAQAIASQTIGVDRLARRRCASSWRRWREACGDRVQCCASTRSGATTCDRPTQLCARLEPGSVAVRARSAGRRPRPNCWRSLARGSRVRWARSPDIGGPADVMQLARAERSRRSSSSIRCAWAASGAPGSARRWPTPAGMAASVRIEGTSGLAVAATLQLAAATPGFTSGHECSLSQAARRHPGRAAAHRRRNAGRAHGAGPGRRSRSRQGRSVPDRRVTASEGVIRTRSVLSPWQRGCARSDPPAPPVARGPALRGGADAACCLNRDALAAHAHPASAPQIEAWDMHTYPCR